MEIVICKERRPGPREGAGGLLSGVLGAIFQVVGDDANSGLKEGSGNGDPERVNGFRQRAE